jgi:DNA-binding NarL/FixJ family response regulator
VRGSARSSNTPDRAGSRDLARPAVRPAGDGHSAPLATSAPQPITVAIADDHPVVLRGLEALIEEQADMTVVATARDGLEAVTRVLATRPQVVVMDIRMPRCNGVEATRRILAEHPEARVIVLSGEKTPSVVEALQAGALGFLSKDAIGASLVEGIRAAADDRPIVSPTVLTGLIEALRQPQYANPLTGREKEIMQLVAAGNTNEQIGRALSVSISTVKALLAALFEKLGARDRASALAVCLRRGWIA